MLFRSVEGLHGIEEVGLRRFALGEDREVAGLRLDEALRGRRLDGGRLLGRLGRLGVREGKVWVKVRSAGRGRAVRGGWTIWSAGADRVLGGPSGGRRGRASSEGRGGKNAPDGSVPSGGPGRWAGPAAGAGRRARGLWTQCMEGMGPSSSRNW